MQRDKHAEMSDREAIERRYARINWNAHLVPLVSEAVAELGGEAQAVGRGEIAADAGEALTVQFGWRPGAADAPAPPGYGRPRVTEGKTALVFSQAASGAVAVLLYPAGTPVAKPEQPYYLIGRCRNPAALTRSRIRRLLRDLLDMHSHCSPHPAAAAGYSRRLLLLEARAAAVQAGGIGWAQLAYLTRLLHGLPGLYRTARKQRQEAVRQQARLLASGASRVDRTPRLGRSFELQAAR